MISIKTDMEKTLEKSHKIIFVLTLIAWLVTSSFYFGLAEANSDTSSQNKNRSASEQIRKGVLQCNAAHSVGSRTPSGAHVPVWDYAVSFNTNILAYKECVLDGINNSIKRAAMSRILEEGINTINEGLNGDPMFVENIPLHYKERIIKPTLNRVIDGEEFENLSEVFRDDIRSSLRNEYDMLVNDPSKTLSCPIDKEVVEACVNGDFDNCGGMQGLTDIMSNPTCVPHFARYVAQGYLEGAINAEVQREQTKLDWGRGFRSVTEEQTIDLPDGSTITVNRIVTPGFLISQYASDLLGSGLRQMENADEIDEIIGLFMSKLGNTILGDRGGLANIKPYLEEMVDEAFADTRGRQVTNMLKALFEKLKEQNKIVESLENLADSIISAKVNLRKTDIMCLDKVVEEAQRATREEMCLISIGTTTGCAIAVSKTYDYGSVEAFESSPGMVSMAGYARNTGTISTVYRASGSSAGLADTNSGSGVRLPGANAGLFYTSAGRDISSLSDGDIAPEASEGSYTTLGDFSFKKTSANGATIYKFSYDLPNVTIIAEDPSGAQQARHIELDLKKDHLQYVVENEYSASIGDGALKSVYESISARESLVKEIENLRKDLRSNPSGALMDRAQRLIELLNENTPGDSFFSDIKEKTNSIRAMSSEVERCWTSESGSGCASPKWCTDERIKSDWRNYIKT